MVDEYPHDDGDAERLGMTVGPGIYLREARERAGLSIQDLANRLHLNASIVEHLEANRFDDLPEPAYVRGYLRAAARALNLDVAPLIAAFDAQGLREPSLDTPPVVSRSVRASPRRGHSRMPYVLGALILIVVAALIGYGWFEDMQDRGMPELAGTRDGTITLRAPVAGDGPGRSPPATDDTPERAVPPPETLVQTPVEPLPPSPMVSDDPGMDPDMSSESGTNLSEAESGTMTIEPAPESAEMPPLPSASASSGIHELTLTFLEDSWVEIHDARDEALLVGLMRESTRRQVSGMAPFRVFLGNAPGVRLRIDGQDYDPSRHARSDNTARFTLERS